MDAQTAQSILNLNDRIQALEKKIKFQGEMIDLISENAGTTTRCLNKITTALENLTIRMR